MAISSYPIDPARVGLVVTQGDPSPYLDQSGRQRFTDDRIPMWQAAVLAADLDLELRLRFAASTCPTWAHNTPLRLEGATRVSSYAGRVAGSQRASLTMRSERVDATDVADDDLFGSSDTGLFLVDTGELTVVAAARLEARFPKTGDWSRFSVVRGWSSSDGELAGMEKWSIDVPGRSFPNVRRMAVVEFDQLRVDTYINADRTTARLDLTASAVRVATPSPTQQATSRRRGEHVTVPAGPDATNQGGDNS